uniref:Lrp/AsnC family transcriptional regulator n=1 Tax=Parabacteroides sp. AM08-6 TaxID=2292053 RepID=UPI000FED1DAB
ATPPAKDALTELEERFLSLLSAEATLSRTQMAERLEMGLDTVKEYLRKLREKGYIERIGGNKRTGRWVVKR